MSERQAKSGWAGSWVLSVIVQRTFARSTLTRGARVPVRSAGTERNLGLDFLRGVAILLVLCSHYTFPRSGIAPLDWVCDVLHRVGGVGVNLFFALS